MNKHKNNIIHDDFYKNSFEIQKNIPKYDILQHSLDRQILDFLEIYYSIKLKSKAELVLAIHKWQYEALIYNVMHAQQNSLAYKDKLAHIPCLELLHDIHEAYCNSELCSNDITVLMHKLLDKIDFTLSLSLLDNSEHYLAIKHDLVSGLISVETSGTSSLASRVWQSTDINKLIAPKKRIFCSDYDLISTVNFFFYGMQYLLNNSDNRVALLMSGERQGSIGHLLHKAMQLLGISCKVLGFPIDEEKTIADLLEYKPTCIIGIPSHVLSISHNKNAAALAPTLNCILLSGDSLPEIMRTVIANNFGCAVFVHYGLTESGFGCAVECKEHEGMHLRQLDLLLEIISEDNKRVPDGQWGEVVITTLTRQAMPLIRYRTGDEGRLVAPNCACGSILKKLEIKGRISQIIAINRTESIHFMELEEFIYAHEWIINFEICIFAGNASLSPCLVLGLKLHENAPENAFELISNELELQYKVTSLNYKLNDYEPNYNKPKNNKPNSDEPNNNKPNSDEPNNNKPKNKLHDCELNSNSLDAEVSQKSHTFLIHTQNNINSLGSFTILAQNQGQKPISKSVSCLICSLDDYLKLSLYNIDAKNDYAELNNIPKVYIPSPKKYIKRVNGAIINNGYIKLK